MRWLDAEAATVHRALAWALEHDPGLAARIAVAVAPWWGLSGRLAAGYQLLTAIAAVTAEGSPDWCAAHRPPRATPCDPRHRRNAQPTCGPISRNVQPLAFSHSANCRCSTLRCGCCIPAPSAHRESSRFTEALR